MQVLLFALYFPILVDQEVGHTGSYIVFKHPTADAMSPKDAESVCRVWGGRLPLLKKDSCGQEFQRISVLSQQDITSFWTVQEEGRLTVYRRLTVSKRSARQCSRFQRMFIEFNSNSYTEVDDISYLTVCVVSNTWIGTVILTLTAIIIILIFLTIKLVLYRIRKIKGYATL